MKEYIDKSSPVPLYYQLKELLLHMIKDETYRVGETIPTEHELSKMYTISRTTVRQAVTELVHEGWLYRVKSKGTFVKRPKIEQSFVQALGSFNDQISSLGKNPHTDLLDFETITVPEKIAEFLQIKQGSRVVYIHRRRYVDSEPIVIVQTYLPLDKCEFVLDHNLAKESLYPILASNPQTELYKIKRFIEAVEARDYDMEHLKIEKHKAIQQFISIGYNVFDEPIEYSIARYRGDRNKFEVIISNNKT